ncbi:uncharacterized protein [Nicotiana sylvestris]|uniref:uncharacterized protein n=1 Tax=Nicotiana sylvestris TaxID=4096 RepID=UPI00388C7847
MAANDQESRVSLKLLVDDKKNQVIAAESNRDFVDILFSFLTFPIGTKIRLTNSQPMSKISPISTCMNNLYQSVENLIVKHLYSENWGGIEFIISDDLRVLPGSPSSLVKLLSDLGYSHMNQLKCGSWQGGDIQIAKRMLSHIQVSNDKNGQCRTAECGNMILRLLACSLISKSPLTEVFLNKKANIVDNNIMPEPGISPLVPNAFQYTGNSWKINLKLILNKSRNKILYAEANDSFVDFLFSFLTFPIGSVIHVLNGISGLGCIDNLYKSVTDLESKWFPYCQHRLLNPGVAPRHKCQNQLLPISVGLDDHSLLDPRCTSGGHK